MKIGLRILHVPCLFMEFSISIDFPIRLPKYAKRSFYPTMFLNKNRIHPKNNLEKRKVNSILYNNKKQYTVDNV